MVRELLQYLLAKSLYTVTFVKSEAASLAGKYHKPCDQEHNSKDDKKRITCLLPASIVEHLGRLTRNTKDC